MTITYRLENTVAIIEFDDGRKNMVTHEILDQFEAAWTEAEASGSAILFTGRPGSFCAGCDINVMTGGDPAAAAALGRRGRLLARRIFEWPKPVVGVAPGHAFTIGLIRLSGCGVRIAKRGPFKMAMTEVALGVPLTGWALG